MHQAFVNLDSPSIGRLIIDSLCTMLRSSFPINNSQTKLMLSTHTSNSQPIQYSRITPIRIYFGLQKNLKRSIGNAGWLSIASVQG